MGESVQYVDSFEKIHLLVGKNSVGKSIILPFAAEVISEIKSHGYGVDDQFMGGVENALQGGTWNS